MIVDKNFKFHKIRFQDSKISVMIAQILAGIATSEAPI